MTTFITVAFGDGIGPEATETALHILREAGADLEIETVEMGARIYAMDCIAGILPSGVARLQRHPILLKAPTATPSQQNYKNVTDSLREFFQLTEEHRIVHDNAYVQEISVVTYINEHLAMFEPMQDIVPEISGKNKADPSGMLLACLKLLSHIGQLEAAERIEYAWRQTLEEGIQIGKPQRGRRIRKIGTSEFAAAIIDRLPVARPRPVLYKPAI